MRKIAPMRSRTNEAIAVLFVYLIASLALLQFNPFNDRFLVPTDLLFYAPGLRNEMPETQRFQPRSGARSDAIDGILPALEIWKYDWVHEKHVSKWNPYAAAGEPAFSNMTMGMLSIRNLPLLFFDVPTAFSIGTEVLFLVAGFGTYLFVRRKTSVLPAVFAGAVFMFSGFNLGWTQWPQFQVSALIPWIFLGGSLIFERKLALGFLVTVVSSWQLIVAGFPSVTGFTIYALFFLSAIVFSMTLATRPTHAWKTGSIFVAALLLGVVCSLSELIPMAQYLLMFDLSHRGAGGLGSGALRWLIKPLRNPRGIFPEDVSYVGIATLIFAVLALCLWFKRRKQFTAASTDFFSPWAWSFLTVFFFIAVFSAPKFIFFNTIAHLPVFSNNPSNRALSVLGFVLAVVAALGAQMILDELSGRWPRLRKCFFGIFALLIVIHFIDVKTIVRDANTVNPRASYYPEVPPIAYMKSHILPGQWVISTGDNVLINGTLTAHRLVDPFAHAFYRESDKTLFGNLVTNAWVTVSASQFKFPAVRLESPWMTVLSVRYVWITAEEFSAHKEPLPKNWKVVYQSPATVVLENLAVQSPAFLSSLAPDHFTAERAVSQSPQSASAVQIDFFDNDKRSNKVHSQKTAYLILPARNWPGFVARANGQVTQAQSLDASVATIAVPAGDSVVEWSYEPPHVGLAGGLSLIGVIVSLVTALVLARSSKAPNGQRSSRQVPDYS